MPAGKRGQAGPIGALLALLAVFIVIYMLMIPPDLRQELLDGETAGKDPAEDSPSSRFSYNETVLEVTPGRIDYLKFSEYDHPLPAVSLYSTTEAEENKIGDAVYIKNGIFHKKTGNVSFSIDDPEDVDNILLYFSVAEGRNNKGRLKVVLNGENLLNKEIGDSLDNPISIRNLEEKNTLSFEVSGVGFRFWTTNEYEIEDIKLFFDRTDTSTQESRNVFMVTDSEKFNLEKASLKFFPDCNRREAGRLNVYLNNVLIFSSVPDCGQLNRIEFSPHIIEAGNNRLSFSSEHGRYLIDQVLVHTELEKMTYPVYYFDLDDRFFKTEIDEDMDKECGDIDGICPKGCDYDLDKDCCLEKTSNYWCDYQPNNQDDRCRAVTSATQCSLCPSGYEDPSGDPPEECEDMCGDDTDNECTAGCSRFYDEDCCFDSDPENFWCDDIPSYGLATCKGALTVDECDACPSDWESEESGFSCPSQVEDDEIAVLKGRYDLNLILKFLDDREKKAGKVFVNGYQFHFFTYGDEYKRNINNYVEDGTNAIKVEPDQTVLDIRKMIVEVEE